MVRKSMLITALVSLVSLIALGLTPSSSTNKVVTTSDASSRVAAGGVAELASPIVTQAAQCIPPKITIGPVSLVGTRPFFNAVQVKFTISDVNPCYKPTQVLVRTKLVKDGVSLDTEKVFTNIQLGENTVSLALIDRTKLGTLFRPGAPEVDQITFVEFTETVIKTTLKDTDQVSGTIK